MELTPNSKACSYATIKMPDVFDAKVKSFDATKASKVPGVKKIFKLDAYAIDWSDAWRSSCSR